MADCAWWDAGCWAKNQANQFLGDAAAQALKTVADGVSGAVGKAFGALGSLWVLTPTPQLDGSSSQGGGNGLPPEVVRVLGYVQWIGILLAILALIALAVAFAWRARSDQAEEMFPKLARVIVGVLIIGSAGALTGAILSGASEKASSTVSFLRGELVSWAMWAAVLSTIIAGIRLIMANAQAAQNWFKGIVTLLLVSTASAATAQAIVSAMDSLAVGIIDRSLTCSASDQSCFGTALSNIMGTAAATGGVNGAIGVILLMIVMGLFALIVSFVQVILMIVRGGMLIVLVGVMPLAASATSTEMGKQWFQKAVGWFLAFALYKPVAAIVYAAGFQMVGQLASSDSSGIVSGLSGIALMAAALITLPALMRFVAPVTAAVAGGGAGAGMGMALGGVAQGAAQLSASRGGSGHDAGPAQPSGSAQTSTRNDSSTQQTSQTQVDASSGAHGGAGQQAATTQAQSAGAGSAAQGGAAAASSAGAGGAAAGGAAALGPVGVAAAAGAQVASGVSQAAKSTVNEGVGQQ